ncbi:YDG/SRA domain-containing protein [Candidatus Chloroploca asiatica]|uniref:YDG/SRA domain-containing protein n=1 Tax=Candidatus Chloroploca asiatica TaxID=1506545 RepID=UPI000BE91500
MPERSFGHIAGHLPGAEFESRIELSRAGVHRPTQAGISGTEQEGADSIVLSGGYEDDSDSGEEIIYTGHGGRDQVTGQQISDQLLTRGNMALVYSQLRGLPVRVIRGASHRSPFSPRSGYRYDFTILGMLGQLTVITGHKINIEHIRYHRAHYYKEI